MIEFFVPDVVVTHQIALIPDFGPLSAKFSSGEFVWNDFLIYGLYLTKLLLLFAGGTAVVGVILGGFRYILGSVVEDKEKGRDTLKHTAIGFALVVLAWAIVDILIALMTI